MEHVIPQSLGNHNVVLPTGVVCDTCNHGKLSNLDNALIDFTAISLLRTLYGIPSKSGKPPTTKLSNASLRMTELGKIELESNSKKAFAYDGKDKMNLQLRGNRRMTPTYFRTITRALFKMTLGCIYIDLPDVAFSERFDPICRMILGLDSFHGYFVASKITPPTHEGVKLSYRFFKNDQGRRSVFCLFHFLGFEMFTDLEIRKWQSLPIVPDGFTIREF